MNLSADDAVPVVRSAPACGILAMISVGLIDASWLKRLSPTLRSRLEQLLNNPDG